MEERLDKLLVRNGLVSNRERAKELILENSVLVNNNVINRPSKMVSINSTIIVNGEDIPYVSKGAYKIEKAIEVFDIDLKGKKILDVGSSTGGFTDYFLQNGATEVHCVDVGTNQLAEKLRNDDRVKVFEKTDFRNYSEKYTYDIISVDVSFISILLFIDKFNEYLENDTVLIILIKPQFECGKMIADKFKGVPLNSDIHNEILNKVISSFEIGDIFCNNLTYSPIRGKSGNIEYLSLFKRNISKRIIDVDEIIENAFFRLL